MIIMMMVEETSLGRGDNETDGRFYTRPESVIRSQGRVETTAEARREKNNNILEKKKVFLLFCQTNVSGFVEDKTSLTLIDKKEHLVKHMDTWHIFWHPLNRSTLKVCGLEASPLHMEVLKFLSPLIDITLCRLNSLVNTLPPPVGIWGKRKKKKTLCLREFFLLLCLL